MPPKNANRTSGRQAAVEVSSDAAASSDEFGSGQEERRRRSSNNKNKTGGTGRSGDGANGDEAEKTIPKNLLTRILHDLFEKDATRVSRDANAAVGKYVDVFVREAIARAAVEKRAGFLEVEDLEKIAPQLLLDL